MRVLLIDDHPAILDFMKNRVRRVIGPRDPSLKVDTATTLREGLELLGTPFDLIITDLNFTTERVRGVETLHQIRVAARHVRTVVYSQNEDVGVIREAIQAGAAGYILKTASAKELDNALYKISQGESYIPAAAQAAGSQSGLDSHIFTKRQLQVLRLIADGLSNKEIGIALGIQGESTVKDHVRAVMEKLDARNRTHTVKLAQVYIDTA